MSVGISAGKKSPICRETVASSSRVFGVNKSQLDMLGSAQSFHHSLLYCIVDISAPNRCGSVFESLGDIYSGLGSKYVVESLSWSQNISGLNES